MRVILVGGPRRGKSTYARELRAMGIPTFCTDALSMVKDPEDGVTYLPEGLEWSEASQYVADNWFTKPGRWCIDGVATARALRKWPGDGMPADKIVIFTDPMCETSKGQEAMAKGVVKVWLEVADRFAPIAEAR